MLSNLKHSKLAFKVGGGYALMGLVLVIVVLVTIFKVNRLTVLNDQVVNLRAPTSRASLMLLNGVNHSLAALRGWMILGKESFRDERRYSWDEEIVPALEKLKDFSGSWTNPENIKRLDLLEDAITSFKRSQQVIENIAQKTANIPAIQILLEEAAPQAAILSTQITTMIDLEAKQVATPERKNLLGIMADVRGTTGLALAAIRAYLLSGDEKFKGQFEVLWSKNKKRFKDLQNASQLLTQRQAKSFVSLSKAHKAFTPLPQRMFISRGAEDWNRANFLLRTKAAPTAATIVKTLNAMAGNQKSLMDTDLLTQQKMVSDLFTSLWSLLGLGVSLSLILGFLLTKGITRPVITIINNLQELAKGGGDMTQRLSVNCPSCSDVTQCTKSECSSFGKNDSCWEGHGSNSLNPDCESVINGRYRTCDECPVYTIATNNELQKLSITFNSFVQMLQVKFKDVVQGVGTMSLSSTELSGIAQQMSKSAAGVSAQSDSVAVAAEEMSANMDSVAAASEQATTNIGIVARATEEMSNTLAGVKESTAEASSVTAEAVAEAKSATTKVQELGLAAREISKVTEVITDISNQTNLLALNATIEAARAGEAGKGFAVVAHEIKELAQQTAKATDQIKNQIEGIQGSTSATVSQIERITEVINTVNDTVNSITGAVEEQVAATEEITSNVSQAAQGLEEVNENVAQSSTVSGQIAQDITMVNQASTSMASLSDEVQSKAQQLSGTAGDLESIAGGFTL